MTGPDDDAAGERTGLLGHGRPGRTGWKGRGRQLVRATVATLKSSYVNVFLIFVPFGIIAGKLGWPAPAVFALNFAAIIPLAAVLSFATEQISLHTGETLGGLLNATFGNAVELIVSIIALAKGEIRLVQASMLGSILSNMLLVLGCCFISGGYGRFQQSFNSTAASTMSSLMAVACAALIIPATLYATLLHSKHSNTDKSILFLSRGTAIIMLGLYLMYLYFQLYSHKSLFVPPKNDDAEQQNGGPNGETEAEEDEEEILGPIGGVIVLLIDTILVSLCADYLVDSIQDVTDSLKVSKTFIGLIVIPIVGNAAEHVTACLVAYKNKMDLAIGVAIGSSMQIALLVTPFLVVLGWIIHQPMTLNFQPFVTVVFFISVLVVNYLVQDGRSNYLEGAMLLGTYTIIALAFFVYPDDAGDELGDKMLRLVL